MELRQVRYFVTVAEELHFGRAAERLHIVQPAVSQQIRRLEREFGLRLLDRTTRAVRLTDAGRAFLPHARALLDAERAAGEAMAGLGAARMLRVGTSQGMHSRLEAVLAELAERAPRLTVELVSGTPAARLRQVRDGELDATFVRGSGARQPGLDLVEVWRDALIVALPAAHPLAARAEVALPDLALLPLRIAPREEHRHLYDLVLGACRDAGFEPAPAPPFTTDQETLAAIGTGRPSWTVYYAQRAGTLPSTRTVFRPLAGAGLHLPMHVAVREGAGSRELRMLVEACAAASSEDA